MPQTFPKRLTRVSSTDHHKASAARHGLLQEVTYELHFVLYLFLWYLRCNALTKTGCSSFSGRNAFDPGERTTNV